MCIRDSTGTIGEVTDSKIENDTSWVKIDKTNLWYLANKLELLNDEDLKTNDYPQDKDIDIEAIKNSEKMFEDVEISSSAANGGG